MGCIQYNPGVGGHSHLYFVLYNGVFPMTEVITHGTRSHRIYRSFNSFSVFSDVIENMSPPSFREFYC